MLDDIERKAAKLSNLKVRNNKTPTNCKGIKGIVGRRMACAKRHCMGQNAFTVNTYGTKFYYTFCKS